MASYPVKSWDRSTCNITYVQLSTSISLNLYWTSLTSKFSQTFITQCSFLINSNATTTFAYKVHQAIYIKVLKCVDNFGDVNKDQLMRFGFLKFCVKYFQNNTILFVLFKVNKNKFQGSGEFFVLTFFWHKLFVFNKFQIVDLQKQQTGTNLFAIFPV